ncbi:MAG: sigma-54 dependent transcriptional regulator [Myxococcota bacterium]
MKAKIGIIEDETTLRELLRRHFIEKGYNPLCAGNLKEGKRIVARETPPVIISDIRLPDGNGLDLIPFALNLRKDTQIIVVTAYGSIDTVFRAMKDGAYHYITKPVNFDELEALVEKALEKSSLLLENINLRAEISRRYDFDAIFGESKAIQDVIGKLKRIADTRASVLIEGESGTGKELAARALHYNSSRATKPFVPVNCGAIPETLLESELFGYVKGAFTGAQKDTQGLFQEAHEGALFLDEISELSQSMQVKLLRTLQENKIRPVGSSKEIDIDVRIIAATNKHLEDEVEAGRFREDLFYRLNVITINMPPLRDRREDIPFLSNIFLQRFNSANSKRIEGFTDESLELLKNYEYPGNIRQLQNIIERAVIMEESPLITPRSLPPLVWGVEEYKKEKLRLLSHIPKEHFDRDIDSPNTWRWDNLIKRVKSGENIKLKDEVEKAVAAMESELIDAALEITEGNQTKAADILNITLRELRYRREKHRETKEEH